MAEDKKGQTTIDFTKLQRPTSSSKPIDPEKIFGTLPNLPHTYNDLWRGQTDALKNWHKQREVTDVLISLNTGAGKTLVGLLIAQSLVNEGVDNVVYVCSTVDLVNQTLREAEKIGINCSIRARGKFSNNFFEIGQSFCITTYSGLFHTFSVFQNKYSPGAIIFDDAHVAEKLLRDAFTLTIQRRKHEALFVETVKLCVPIFDRYGRKETLNDIFTRGQQHVLMVPPGEVRSIATQLGEILRKHGVHDDNQLKFPYNYLKDNISECAVFITNGIVEISPPFLPVFVLPYFESNKVRRIYLSATLNYKSDLARAFGRVPKVIVEPNNDAGNGERLILFADYFGRNEVSPQLMRELTSKYKAVVSVPSYKRAEQWAEFSAPPAPEDFSDELNRFRKSKRGVFVLVSRVDGIDLPHETCRVMIVDGLPTGFTLLERYQWEMLSMQNLYATKLANRLTQLFGRINRGRNDYGVFIVSGRDVNNWLQRNRSLALLPDLLRKQALLGKALHDQTAIKNVDDVMGVITPVLERDEGWMAFYADTIAGMDVDSESHQQAQSTEEIFTAAATAEAAFASAVWDHDFPTARAALEKVIENVGRADGKLAGWYNVWLGMCYEAENDQKAALQEYNRARSRLGRNMVLPRPQVAAPSNGSLESKPNFVRKMMELLITESPNTFQREVEALQTAFSSIADANATTRQSEEGVRRLGDQLGLVSTRPDNDDHVGPDVLWHDESSNVVLAFELKTDKDDPANYKKEEIGQGHNHLGWISENYSTASCLGLLFVGPSGTCSVQSNPSDTMYLSSPEDLAQLANVYIAALHDIRRVPPIERMSKVEDLFKRENLDVSGLFQRLAQRKLRDMKS